MAKQTSKLKVVKAGNTPAEAVNTKTCPVCKREFNNRKKWESRGMWSQIVYCSKACRAKA